MRSSSSTVSQSQTAARALIGDGRIGEAIRDHDLPSSSAGRIHCSTFWARAANISSSSAVGLSSRIGRIEQNAPDLLADGVPPGSTLSSTAGLRAQTFGQHAGLGAFAAAVGPFEGDEEARARPLIVDIVQDLLQILPRFLLRVLIVGPQQVRRDGK
jgi:hypothetical protein